MDTQTTDRVAGLAVRRSGTGEPVLALHASGGGLDSWAGVAGLLSDEFEVWRCARRGYAPSRRAEPHRTFASEVVGLRDLLDTVRAVTDSDVHLVGAGYGALLALHLAAGDLSGVRSLVLYEPPVLLSGPHLLPVRERYRALMAAEQFASGAELLDREVFRVPETSVPIRPPVSVLDPPRAHQDAAGWLPDLEALAADGTDIARWSSVTVPVLLAQGADSWDPLPAGMDALAAVLPHVERVVWEGESLWAMNTAPELVARTLRSFLAGND
ncbi:MAG: alpha/beta fold hydrolase [Janthinobacterium lividum]